MDVPPPGPPEPRRGWRSDPLPSVQSARAASRAPGRSRSYSRIQAHHAASLPQVADDDIGAGGDQRLELCRPVDADDEPEPAPPPRLDTCDRVLDDRRLRRIDS